MVDSEGWVGTGSCLALDAAGHPHISYYRYPSSIDNISGLKYAAWNGASWDIHTADSIGVGCWAPGSTSLVLDASDRPHISYCDAASTGHPHVPSVLKYAVWNGTGWEVQVVDGPDVGHYSSLALDASGYPRISYQDYANGDLKYAAWDGTSWNIQVVDDGAFVFQYQYTSLALDSSWRPRIGYYDRRNEHLKYAAWDGASWDIETVDSVGRVGEWDSLALDASGRPHISYWDRTNEDLKYATTSPPAQAFHVLSTTGYYMISLPLTPASATPHDVFSDDLGDGHYYMWGWDGGGYETLLTSTPGSQGTTLSAQKGYWMLASAAMLDIDVGGTLPHGDQAIPLQAGWNMFGAPYEVTMDSLLVDNGGDVRSLAHAQAAGWALATFYYSHDGTGSYSTLTIGETPADTLSFWHGYWVLAGLDCSLVIPAPSGGSGGATTVALRRAPPSPTWAFDIQATSGCSVDIVTIAAADGASEDFDGFALDRPKPPPGPGQGRLRMALTLGGRPTVAHSSPLSQLAMETRGTGEEAAEWRFTVAGGVEGEPVTLRWADLSRFPKDRVAILRDLDTGTGTFMRSRGRYEFAAPANGNGRNFAVVVKPVQQTCCVITNFSVLPLRGGRGAEIDFGLLADAKVDIAVLNVAGRLVERVRENASAEAGTHTVIWNGRSMAGTALPNGTYICVLSAKAEDGQQARRVCPLTVGR